ncbi:hypothetical protein Q3G72_021992 [Acer saccharum]|nr:hypothetical protein Q3G72_021992 [Acer saccharum]
MAGGAFGRVIRDSIRFQCGGRSCTSNKRKKLSVSKRRLVVVNPSPPPIKQKLSPLKAGTEPEPEPEPEPEQDFSTTHNQYLENTQNNHQDNQSFCSRLGLDSQLQQEQQQPQQQTQKKRSYFPSSSTSILGQEAGIQYARKMGESHNNQAATSSRLGIRSTGGEIVEVQGGHIVRSTGRKDRHSKVCTAKGPRDRRVRLSAHTAIQFYDVQDRLGYDRPSKAVDWLIKKAKASIDELAELPPWNPETIAATMAATTTTKNNKSSQQLNQTNNNSNNNERDFDFSRTTMVGNNTDHDVRNLHMEGSSFLPPSLDSDSIADTIKSFFPIGASNETPSSSIQFQNYPPDLLSRTPSHSQDLRLSLQSFQEPNNMLLQHQQPPHHHAHSQVQTQQQQQQHQNEPVQVLFSGTTPLGYDSSNAGWHESEHHHNNHSAEMSRFQRMVAWNSGGGADTTGSGGGGGGGGGGGFMFNSPPTQPLFGQNQFFTQRGPLQSSNTPSVRAWIDQPISLTSNDHHDHHHHHHHQHHHHQIPQPTLNQSLISSIGFASSAILCFLRFSPLIELKIQIFPSNRSL